MFRSGCDTTAIWFFRLFSQRCFPCIARVVVSLRKRVPFDPRGVGSHFSPALAWPLQFAILLNHMLVSNFSLRAIKVQVATINFFESKAQTQSISIFFVEFFSLVMPVRTQRSHTRHVCKACRWFVLHPSSCSRLEWFCVLFRCVSNSVRVVRVRVVFFRLQVVFPLLFLLSLIRRSLQAVVSIVLCAHCCCELWMFVRFTGVAPFSWTMWKRSVLSRFLMSSKDWRWSWPRVCALLRICRVASVTSKCSLSLSSRLEIWNLDTCARSVVSKVAKVRLLR